MTIKRVLIHIGHNEQRALVRLEAGIMLAHQFGAALHGLFVIERAALPAQIEGRSASRAYIEEAIAAVKEKAAAIEAEFRQRCGQEDIAWSWTSAQGETLAIMAEHALYTDLTIVGQQASSGLDDVMSFHRTDHLPLRSPGPVLIMPRAGKPRLTLDSIVLAWKPTQSCARAMRDAMPLLHRARSVTVLTIEEETDSELPVTAVGDLLAAHGLKVTFETRQSDGNADVGDAILTAAADMKADMLVMGAHGHSRLKELIFGGATHDVLDRMQLPVLMSH